LVWQVADPVLNHFEIAGAAVLLDIEANDVIEAYYDSKRGGITSKHNHNFK
jgi:hypothetical protein